MQKILISCVRFYQLTISSLSGRCCRFQPTCSEYARQAIEIHGCIKGTWLTLKRLLKCHPWGKSGYDPVPPKE
ncbi:MAG: membrane protein insertion efficiency factor YidD [Alphaproteobacteria bacterium]|nr:membrane protein insertion efficiency factor YidD [Alphaproteobacteria bacterium]